MLFLSWLFLTNVAIADCVCDTYNEQYGCDRGQNQIYNLPEPDPSPTPTDEVEDNSQ